MVLRELPLQPTALSVRNLSAHRYVATIYFVSQLLFESGLNHSPKIFFPDLLPFQEPNYHFGGVGHVGQGLPC